ncbi:VOC family protein [uncultured Dokdonia sp.]|uniref:VOC family protein n=1 Tax=uncultured Dokdonia sp. TaxID=575653 RepID=UPI002611D011|nr:VOC family protein [uncultured Dokdonia sp.]
MEMKLSWFEVPVTNMERAILFYEDVFGIKIDLQDFTGVLMGFFPRPDNEGASSGSLIQYKSCIPSEEGSLLYFNAADITACLERVSTAGGKVLQNKTQISEEHGYMATFIDSEGNKVALHSTH